MISLKRLFCTFCILSAVITSTFSQQLISLSNTVLTNSGDTEPLRKVRIDGNGNTTVEYTFSGFNRSGKKHNETVYDILSFHGFGHMNYAGKPGLPMHIDYVLVPSGENIKIKIKAVEYTELQNYYIYPALQPARDTKGAPEPQFELDQKTYSTDAFFPENNLELLSVRELRSFKIANIVIQPVQFNPVTKTIRIIKHIVFEIQDSPAPSEELQAERNSAHFYNLIKAAVINPEALALAETKSVVTIGGYLLLTTSDLKSAADTLAKWKRQLGYDVTVITKPFWTAQAIKDTIHNRYQSASVHPDFFVLLGDIDRCPGELIAPDNFSCDLYFACMNGATDFTSDMAHGRISVATPAEAMDVVLKIVQYERTPVSDPAFYTYGLHCAQYQDDNLDSYADRRFAQTSEDALNYMNSLGYTTQRVYFTYPQATPLYWNNDYYSAGEPLPSYLLKPGFAWDGDAQDVVDGINAGPVYVLHRDHGYSGGWGEPDFSVADIPFLNNGGKLPVMFSINCSSGAFGDAACFAEQMLRKKNGGAVGVIAASNYSYSGYNDGFALGLFDAIWAVPGLIPNFTGGGGINNPTLTPHPPIPTMGDVLNQGLLRMGETWGIDSYTHELFHYHGDPAMKIWTSVPQSITAVHPVTVECDTTQISISGCSCLDAMATIVFNGQLIGSVQLVNGSGTITFPPVTNIVPHIILTISKTNYRPYIAYLPIQNCAYPPNAAFEISSSQEVLCGGFTDIVQLTDVSSYSPTTWQWEIQPGTFSFAGGSNATTQHPEVVFNALGTYTVKLKVTNTFGVDSVVQASVISVVPGLGLPLTEGFEDQQFPPAGWFLTNPDASYTWERVTGTSGNGTSTAAPAVKCYSYSTVGALDGLSTPVLNLSGIPAARLDFKVAYHAYYNYTDTLSVYVSTDCGVTYSATPIWKKGGLNLQTTMGTNYFIPAIPADWRQESIDLTAYCGSAVVFKFESNNQYGNNMYIDDVNIYQSNVAPQPDFYAPVTSVGCNGTTVPLDFYDMTSYNPTSWTWSVSPNTVVFVSPTTANSQNPRILFTQYGDYAVTLTASNTYGNNSITKTSYIHISPPAALPLVEEFESGIFPPSGWLVSNPDASNTWQSNPWAAGNGTSTASASIDLYSYYPASGQKDDMVTPAIDLSGAANAALTFDVAYRTFGTYYDTLRVLVSTDCGQTFLPTPAYTKSGLTLQTSAGSGAFTPMVYTDWRNEFVDLSPWVGQNIVLAFQSSNAYGNNLFIDDINIQSTTAIEHSEGDESIMLFPNPNSGTFTLAFSVEKAGDATLSLYDARGCLVLVEKMAVHEGLNSIQTGNQNLPAGLYKLVLNADGAGAVKTVVISEK